MSTLDELIGRFEKMPAKDVSEALKEADKIIGDDRWVPNPGPQTEAYYSKADCLLYGGEPGGGKSQLLLGLAFNCHQRSLVMRRKYGDLDRIIEDALKINGGREGFNGSPPPKLRFSKDRTINFGAAQHPGDEQGMMGRGHDLLAIDEATHFAQTQIRFLMGWVRTETPGQRCRTVLATNPPLAAEGMWVLEMFAPWLDPKHPNPAKPGELRWVVSDEDGKDEWVSGPDDVREIRGKIIRPTSRTYIPASVRDNPYYNMTDYERQLDAMPEPYRSLLMGGFRTAFKDADNQVIPTVWIEAAQKRWTPYPPSNVPMCALGVDMSGGGEDPMVIACRHDGWFAPVVVVPGKSLPMESIGADSVGHIYRHRRDKATIVLDMGGGYGSSAFEHLRSNSEDDIVAYKGAEASLQRTFDRKMGFTNRRSEVLWKFREALDPGQPGGSPIMLPADPELVADLAAPTFKVTPRGIQVEAKDEIVKRLGRSPDRGDAVVMAWSAGLKQLHVEGGFVQRDQRVGKRNAPVKVISGRR